MSSPPPSRPGFNGSSGSGHLPPQTPPCTWQPQPGSPPASARPTPPHAYGYVGATPPPSPPVRPRRRRVALVSALTVVLVLAIGGTAALIMRHRGTDDDTSTASTDRWSPSWLDGFEEAWTLEAPADFRRQEMSMRIRGDRMVRTTSTSATATVTVFDISGDSPKQLWETKQEVTETVDGTMLWDGQIIVETTLIDIDSQERSTTPWDTDARVTVTSAGAVACVEATCRCWSSPSELLWESTFPEGEHMTVGPDRTMDGYSIASSSDYGEYFVVDVNTGAANLLEAQKADIIRPLADGWLVHSGGSARTDATVKLYEPDGTFSESFKFRTNAAFSTYPWSPTPFTREQARLWLEDFDTSWAPATYTVSETDSSCESITINGNDVVLGEDNSLTAADKRGGCTTTSALQALYHSGEGAVQSFARTEGDERSLVLVDMATGRASESIPLGTTDDYAGYTPLGDLLVVNYASGVSRAYRPAS
ncbi:hypothetical protein [Actinomyces sp.]|uniref:hypothetical protein n=1 Tax=Actinomyces sp. TaxID=29317 RepID=UPI0026DD6232|nr:hypothetical protein [Actinomyces sp.]MDO4901668.1 hypothetical protein [Actinomyces sp.]